MTTAVGNGTIGAAESGASLYATFTVGELLFGVDVTNVQEILRYQRMTPVPLAPPVIRGLINLRGQIIAAVDMRRRLGLPERAGDAEPPMNVVVRSADGVISLLVDDIGDVLEVRDVECERTPDTVKGAAREVVRKVAKLSDRLMLVLDTERAVETGIV